MRTVPKIILIVVVLIIVVGGVMAYNTAHTRPAASVAQPTPNGPVVTLTPDGFSPSEVHVKVGDTVTFVTTAGKPFWPASDLHPSHLLYPEFDPQLPIAPNASWSFTFEKVGSWRYHDHLAPYFTGTIVVRAL